MKRPWAYNGAPFGVMLGENRYPRLNLQWLVKLQRLAEASDRLRVVEPPRFRRACRGTRLDQRQSPSRATRSRLSPQRQAALRSNLMTKGLSMGRDLTDKQIGRVMGSKLVKQFGG
jgi:hypothetical protein